MDIYSTFATDEKSEIEGRWFPMGPKGKVLVARTGNPRYLKVLRQLMQDSQVDHEDTSQENEDLVTSLLVDAMAQTVLLGWKGLEYQKKPLEYSHANAKTLLTVRAFRKRISDIADKHESFLIREEAAQGND